MARADPRLAFLEALLACDTPEMAAELGADWLARNAGAAEVFVAIVDRGASPPARLVGAAARGLSAKLAVVAADDERSPLVRAMRAGRSVVLASGALGVELGFTGARCSVHPLPGAIGVVVVGGKPAGPAVRWCVRHLGRKLADLVSLRGLGANDRKATLARSARYEELKRSSSALEGKVKDATAELVRQNKLLHRQAIELEAASSAKSLFLANMSHEFRTPLNAILGYTSMILQGVSGPLPANLARQLSRIDSNGRHLLTIINDILDIARIEAGKMPFNPAKFVAADLVKEVLAELEPLVVRSKLRVGSEIGERVPVLDTDRAKVKQILVNLISNALKFTPDGSVTVSVQWHERTDETWVSVADTGIGIADADRDAVFEDFRQVDGSPTRPYGGTGLGLAICRRLANVLGAHVRLASKVDRGSTFTLVLPAKTSDVRRAATSRRR